MAENGVQFAKKVGIVAGAFLATIAMGNILSGAVVKYMMQPVVADMVAEERRARVSADSLMTAQWAGVAMKMSADRITLLEIMSTPPGSVQRERMIQKARRGWRAKS